jgi:ankyrin repeat protein
MAVWAWDLKAVRLLLEAGADPNNTGDQMAEVWREGNVLAVFNDILDRSPLDIIQTMGCIFRATDSMKERQQYQR